MVHGFFVGGSSDWGYPLVPAGICSHLFRLECVAGVHEVVRPVRGCNHRGRHPGDGRTGAVLETRRVRESSVIEFEESESADYVACARSGW